MIFKGATETSLLWFLIICLVVILMETVGIYFAYRKRKKGKPALKAGIFFFAMLWWLIAVAKFSASGIMAANPMPMIPIFFAVNLLTAVAFAFSPVGTALAALPLPALVAFQGFRLPLELVLHDWAEQEVIPTTMTWTGSNWDIVTGIVSLALAPFSKNPAVAWVANIIGIVLLFNVARVAVMSSPLPFAWDVQPPLQLAFFIPYSWIAPVCVAGALAGHIILTRALLWKR